MKKILIPILIFSLSLASASAAELDTSAWYTYNGYSEVHNFALQFPQNWKSLIIDEKLQGLLPKEDNLEDPLVYIREFSGQTYNQALQYFASDGFTLSRSTDQLFKLHRTDLVGKEAVYLNASTNESKTVNLIKRGSLILAIWDEIPEENEEQKQISEQIKQSLYFTDNWNQYFDLQNQYSFVYPSKFTLHQIENGVQLRTAGDNPLPIFTALVNTEADSLKEAAKDAELENENYQSQTAINFHGYTEAIRAEYQNTAANKKFAKIVFKNRDRYYSLSDENIVKDFPRSEYNNQYLADIVESFESFNIAYSGDYSPFQNFPDVRDNHPNATAINNLTQNEIINGYPDGEFKPNGLINRAELTKMVVASQVDPDPEVFKNCFPDVTTQWFAPYICYAKNKNWVEGYPNGYFRPETNISRVEAIKIVMEALLAEQLTDQVLEDDVSDIQQGQWYSTYFNFASNNDFLDLQHIQGSQDGAYSYLPAQNISRKEVAELIYRSSQ